MIDFLNTIIYGDYQEMLGDLYTPVLAAVAASSSIIVVGAVATTFTSIFAIVLNFRGRKV